MKRSILTIAILFMMIVKSSAQDDLLNVLQENQTVKSENVMATFKTLKLISVQTNETVHKHVLDFRIAHRFGNMSVNTGGGFHEFYGLDEASDIRIAFEYGITDRLQVGVSRSKYNENLEGLIKYRLLQQTTDNKRPVSITVFANTSYTPKKDLTGEFQEDDNGTIKKLPARRLKYATQIIFARQFTSRFSVLLSPLYVHRNYISDPKDQNDLFALGAGLRLKVTRSMCIIADYYYTFSDYRRNTADPKYYDPLGLGLEFETGGHVFSIMFTNSPAIIETEFLDTYDSWSDGGIKFSFNISRNFSMGK